MRVVLALGGNALLQRGEIATIARQRANARQAAALIAPLAARHEIVLTHGNGPQVGALAAGSRRSNVDAGDPLDVLDAESEGLIGYLLELELRNLLPSDLSLATVLTMVEVDAADPAFTRPTKFIGPVYSQADAQKLAGEQGWDIAPDGACWRRVVASPEPVRILELDAIQTLSEAGMVICAGGGGVPVARGRDGSLAGVEAVVDKDLSSELLARELDVDLLVLATDVDAVYAGWQTDRATPIRTATPQQMQAMSFPAGSMGPKVEAACRFVRLTGRTAMIGGLAQLPELLAGRSGTTVCLDPDQPIGAEI